MTDPAGGPPPTPAGGPPPTPPAPDSWQTPPPAASAPGGFQTAQVAAGPAPGVAYADLTTRIIAYIIDSILLGVVTLIVAFAVGVAVLGALLAGGAILAFIGLMVVAAVALFASAVYFVYTWTTMRASPGQKMLNLETVNQADGATLTRDQAIRRWAFLFGPQTVAGVGQIVLGATSIAFLGSLLSLLSFLYVIYLLYTASQSAKRQGFHDVQAGHRGRQAPRLRALLDRTNPDGAGIAGPVSIPPSFRLGARDRRSGLLPAQGSKSRLRTWRGRNTASGRRSNAATRRIPSRSAVATSSASASRGRCSRGLVEQLRRPGPGRPASGPRAGSSPRRSTATTACAGRQPELALEQQVELRERERAEQERLVHAREPARRPPRG